MARNAVMVKDLAIKLYFVDVDGEEVLDKTRTVSEALADLESRAEEILQDEETVHEAAKAFFASKGAGGVSASVVPMGFLVNHIHTVLGSTGDNFGRNDRKIKEALKAIVLSSGKGGAKMLPPEEIAAKRLARAIKRQANKEAKLAAMVAAANK